MKNGFFKKLAAGIVSGIMCLTMIPQVPASYAANVGDKLSVGNGTTQHKGNCDGYSYEVWIDTTGGSGSMTLGKGAAFTAEWNASVSSGNFLARRGLDFGSQKKATDYPYIGMDYEADYRQTGSASGNSRLCVYGWFQNKGAGGNVPLVEYYIIEDWVDWCPDGNGKMVTIDGAQYKIFQLDHTGPTINGGSETFKQYFSVRQDKRTSGHITVSDHFKAWADQGWGIGNLYEVALNAEGWQSSGVADVKKLDVYTDPSQAGSGNGGNGNNGNGGNTTPPASTVEPDADGNYFKNDFESGAGDWTGRGAASVTVDSQNYYAGSKSLLVSGRTDNWNGAAISLSSSTFVPGNAYSFSTGVMQKSGSDVEMKMTLQYTDASGTEQYDEVASATAKSGEWTKLENTSYTIPAGASSMILYIEAPDSLTDFYIDEAQGSKEGTKSSVTTGGSNDTPPTTTSPASSGNIIWGDANDDGVVTMADAAAILQYLGNADKYKLSDSGKIAADVFENGKGITPKDALTIQQYIAGIVKKLPVGDIATTTAKPTTTTTTVTTAAPVVTAPPATTAAPSLGGTDISWIDPNKPMLAISFDDGTKTPGKRIIDAIAKEGFHATFFYVGDWITDPSQVQYAYQNGMEIANHTMSHPSLDQKSANEIRQEADGCHNKLKSIINAEPSKVLRLPYLANSPTVQSTLNDYALITCAIDTQDWNGASKDQIVNTVKQAMSNGSANGAIILCHETYDATAAAMEELCPYIKSQGWQLVTVSEMAAAKGKTIGGGQVYTKF